MVAIKAFEPSHVELLARWLARPHVARWYRDPERDLAQARNPAPGRSQAIITWNAIDVGYLRWIPVGRELLDSIGLTEIPTNSVDADILIGDDAAIGHGVGPAALTMMVEEIRRDPAVPLVGLTTELANTRAHRAFEKAGFHKMLQYDPPKLGRCHLMIRMLR